MFFLSRQQKCHPRSDQRVFNCYRPVWTFDSNQLVSCHEYQLRPNHLRPDRPDQRQLRHDGRPSLLIESLVDLYLIFDRIVSKPTDNQPYHVLDGQNTAVRRGDRVGQSLHRVGFDGFRGGPFESARSAAGIARLPAQLRLVPAQSVQSECGMFVCQPDKCVWMISIT